MLLADQRRHAAVRAAWEGLTTDEAAIIQFFIPRAAGVGPGINGVQVTYVCMTCDTIDETDI